MSIEESGKYIFYIKDSNIVNSMDGSGQISGIASASLLSSEVKKLSNAIEATAADSGNALSNAVNDLSSTVSADIKAKISTAYKTQGTVSSFSYLKGRLEGTLSSETGALLEWDNGDVYNVLSDDSSAGAVDTGINYVLVSCDNSLSAWENYSSKEESAFYIHTWDGKACFLDRLGGFADMSKYCTKAQLSAAEDASAAKFTALKIAASSYLSAVNSDSGLNDLFNALSVFAGTILNSL